MNSTEIAILDWRKNLNEDYGDGSSAGLYYKFEIELHRESANQLATINFDNTDYTDEGALVDDTAEEKNTETEKTKSIYLATHDCDNDTHFAFADKNECIAFCKHNTEFSWIRLPLRVKESDFIQRLITEKTELDEKKSKLEAFRNSDAFKTIPSNQRSLLNVQLIAMGTYSQCLEERLLLLH